MGKESPRDMLASMGSIDLALWLEYYSRSGFGETREDLRHGIRASLFANTHSKRRWKPVDFIPRFGRAARRTKSWVDQLRVVELLNQAFGGRDLRKKKDG